MLLVTGITGHSGKYFYQQLLSSQYEADMRFVIRKGSDISFLKQDAINSDIVYGDLKDSKFLCTVFDKVDTVLHIASIFYSINIVEEAIKHDVKQIVLVHTTGIFSKYKSASLEYKEIENRINQLINESRKNIKLIILRPSMIFGYQNDRNISVFIKLVKRFKVIPIVNQGQGLIQPVHGSDLGKAYFQVLNNIDKLVSNDYILSGQRVLTMKELLQDISDYLGVRRIFISVPLWLAVTFAWFLKIVTFKRIDYVEKVLRLVENRNYEHKMATSDFGYLPGSFDVNLKSEVQSFLNIKGIE